VLSAHLDTLSDRATAAALRQDMVGMTRLVDQLLAVAELDSIPSEPPVMLDLAGHARELAASMAPYALKAGRPLAVLGTTAAVPIRGHPEAIRRALRNLVENAVQHAPRGSTIEIEVTDEPAVHVLDRGPGIPAAMHSRVRERFWRGDRSRDGGAGLGLAIVERIAEAENARLVIGDREGGGADISLVFASAGR
jgi:signal transduction histidine kinase